MHVYVCMCMYVYSFINIESWYPSFYVSYIYSAIIYTFTYTAVKNANLIHIHNVHGDLCHKLNATYSSNLKFKYNMKYINITYIKYINIMHCEMECFNK